MNKQKSICGNCIEEEFLKKDIESYGSIAKCSYCGAERKTSDLDSVVENILDGIEFIYDDPANGLGFVDGEYVKGNGDIFDTFDLLMDEFGLGGSNAFQDILDSLPLQLWCKKDFYGLDSAEEMIYTWDYFVSQVKYKTRYFFIKERINIREHVSFNKPYDILDCFASSMIKFGLIDTLDKDNIIYRARRNNKNKKYTVAEEIGTPKAEECIQPNRMSPAGIPMFYGSSTVETCLSELKNIKGNYTIGKWKPKKNLKILNLTRYFKFNSDINKYFYPEFPSIFDKANREKTFDYQFILKFASDLSGEIRQGLEY